jgi:hypothetical protein
MCPAADAGERRRRMEEDQAEVLSTIQPARWQRKKPSMGLPVLETAAR